MPEFLIIAGSARSGTSMMGTTLNSYPDVAIFAEFSLTNVLRSIQETLFAGMEDKQLAPYDAAAIEQFLRPTISEHGRDLLNGIYKNVYPGKTPRILGNKAPTVVALEDIDYLLSRIPNIKIIYMVRSCRSVVRSSMTRRADSEHALDSWLIANEREAINEWIYSFFVGRYLASKASVLFVKFEDLITAHYREANRIREYIGAAKLNFALAKSGSVAPPSLRALDEYSVDLIAMLERWDQMTIDEIMAHPLDAEFSRLSGAWRPMGTPLCDIGTHENFNKPEPWGCWSKPGYFGLRPRFYEEGAAIALILLEFQEKKEELERIELRCYVGLERAQIVEIEDHGDAACVVIKPPHHCLGEALVIKVFFDSAQCFPPDPRQLGLRVKRYRLLAGDRSTSSTNTNSRG